MIYFISEDSNSAHKFWIQVLDLFVRDYTEIDCDINGNKVSGNTSLYNKVRLALSKACANDILFIALDNISATCKNSPKVFDIKTFIHNTAYACKKINVDFWITNYYCFEEVYITYNELERLCRVYSKDSNSTNIADALCYVRECKDKGIEYWDKNNKHVRDIINITKDAEVNKEHFTDALLRHATKIIKHGLFGITKHKNGMGICWIYSCDEIRKRKESSKISNQLSYFCNMCQYKLKNTCDKQKLIDLNNNSVLKYAGIRFDELSSYKNS